MQRQYDVVCPMCSTEGDKQGAGFLWVADEIGRLTQVTCKNCKGEGFIRQDDVEALNHRDLSWVLPKK